MTHEERINYFRIALGMCGIETHNKSCDLLIKINDLIKKKKGKTDLLSTCEIIAQNNKDFPVKKDDLLKYKELYEKILDENETLRKEIIEQKEAYFHINEHRENLETKIKELEKIINNE